MDDVGNIVLLEAGPQCRLITYVYFGENVIWPARDFVKALNRTRVSEAVDVYELVLLILLDHMVEKVGPDKPSAAGYRNGPFKLY